MDLIREFVVALKGDVDGAGFDKMGKAIDGVSESVMGFAQMAAGALTAGAFAMAVRATADRFNELGDIAERVGGVTVTQLDRLGYIAELSGSDAATAQASFESLSKTIGEAASGVGRGAQLFQQFGISAKNADGSVRSVEQVMGDLGKKLEGLSNAEQQAMIQRLGLDRSMIGVLTADTAAIGAEYDERTKLLGVNADQMAEMSGEFNDSIAVMSRSMNDVFTAFVMRILPTLTNAFQSVSKWITSSAQGIRKFIDPIAKGFNVLVILAKNAAKTIATFADTFSPLIIGIGGTAAAIKALNAIWSLSPLGKAVAAIAAVSAAIGLLVDDFQTFRDGGKSFFQFWAPVVKLVDDCSAAWDRFNKRMTETGAWSSLAKAASAVFDTIGGAIKTVYTAFEVMVAGFLSLFTGNTEELKKAWEGFGTAFEDTLNGISDFFTGIFDGIANYFGTSLEKMTTAVTDWVKNKFKGALGSLKGFFGFGDDEESTSAGSGEAKQPQQLTAAPSISPGYALSPAVVNSGSTTNSVTNNRTLNQTVNVTDNRAAVQAARLATRDLAGAD